MTVDRLRLRPAHDASAFARIYAKPHNHANGLGHKVRVAVTVQITAVLAGQVESAADLSCGDGTILNALTARTKYYGDYAPGYALTGLIDDTIEQIPVVDLYICCETLEHVDDPDTTLKLVRGKAKTLVLSTPVAAWRATNPEHYWAWSREGVERTLADAGFPVVAYSAVDCRAGGGEDEFGVWVCR